MSQLDAVTIKLHELPPSVNVMWRATPTGNGKARNVLSREGRAWKEAATYVLNTQKGIGGEKGYWAARVLVPGKYKGDLDNLSKGILDALVGANKVPDDKYLVDYGLLFHDSDAVLVKVWREDLDYWASVKGITTRTKRTMI